MHISCDFFVQKNIFSIHFMTSYLSFLCYNIIIKQDGEDMRTLYIDVYFLINFTVDILALYFAAKLSKVPTSTKRLIVASSLGAIVAVFVVLLPENQLLQLVISTIGLIAISLIAPRGVGIKRKIKFAFSFFIFEALVGGGVSFVWGLFDKYISKFFDRSEGSVVNRKMLFLALIVLLSIGVFKMIVSFFSNIESEGSVDVEISFLNNKTVVSAFIDSGNLAVDPMDMSPILLIKKEIAKTILPENIIELSGIDSLDRNIKKRIRLIPVSRGGHTHVLVGVKADKVKVLKGESEEEITVTLAIDKEGGDFGGYRALMPSAALDNVLH